MKKIQTFLSENYKYLLFCVIFAVINALFIGTNLWSFGRKKVLFLLIFVVIYLALCGLGFYLKQKKNLKTHQLFLVFALVLGALLTFAMPLGMAPDEINHFRRAYEISDGHLVSDRNEQGVGGNYLPNAINILDIFSDRAGNSKGDYDYGQILGIMQESADDNEYVFQNFGNTSLYSAAPYLPQVLGIEVGKVLHLPVCIIMYLARLCNLIFWIIVVYFAVKFIPIGKSIICLLLLSPISLQAAASCQIDAFTNAAIIGMIAFVLYKLKNPKLLSRPEKIVAILLAVALALSKIVYLPLCFLLLLLPRTCFKSRKDKIIKLTLLLAFATILNLAWLAIASGYLVEFQPGVDSPAQVHYILTNPLAYIATVFHTYTENGLGFLMDSLSPNLGYLHIGISRTYIVVLLLFTFYAYLSDDKESLEITPIQKLLIAVILLIVVGLISTSLYVQWTALEAPIISGIQGRYFTAILPLGLLLITPLGAKNLKKHIDPDKSLYALSLAAAIELYAITSIVAFYL